MQRVGEAAGQHGSGSAEASFFSSAQVDAGVAGTMFQGKLHYFNRIDSTQVPALAAGQAGAEAGQVYVAEEQTAGRGRGDHTWHSEPASGLYLSVLVRPALQADQVLRLSLAAGLAAQAAIRQVSAMPIDLRWPNDLVTCGMESRKVGGILTESALQSDGRLRYAVIGMGINVNQMAMPAALQEVSASLRMLRGAEIQREDLLIALLLHLDEELQRVGQNPSDLLQRFETASTWVRGRRVRVLEGEGYTGTTDGLDATGLLRVRCDDGTRRRVLHGGVRELR